MLRKLKLALAAMIGLMLVTVLMTARSTLTPSGVKSGETEFALEVPTEGELAEESEVVASQPEPAISDSEARNVGGGLIAAPEVIEGELERLEALPQPTPPAPPKPPEPFKPNNFMRWKLVYNSVISAAGVFDVNGTALVLPGIDIIAANETCTAPNGAEWPCGMVARTAFRNYVKGRAITCKVPDVPSQDSIAAECLMSGQDMAGWLVEHGWAKAKPDTLYVDLETAAKGYRRGIFGNPPLGVEAVSRTGAEPVLPTQPAANP